jgi:hypothetical protein
MSLGTHAFSQTMSVPGQVHCAAAHVAPVAHALPQRAQLLTSVFVSTQAPPHESLVHAHAPPEHA